MSHGSTKTAAAPAADDSGAADANVARSAARTANLFANTKQRVLAVDPDSLPPQPAQSLYRLNFRRPPTDLPLRAPLSSLSDKSNALELARGRRERAYLERALRAHEHAASELQAACQLQQRRADADRFITSSQLASLQVAAAEASIPPPAAPPTAAPQPHCAAHWEGKTRPGASFGRVSHFGRYAEAVQGHW
jgi:hypothetical protein